MCVDLKNNLVPWKKLAPLRTRVCEVNRGKFGDKWQFFLGIITLREKKFLEIDKIINRRLKLLYLTKLSVMS